MRNWRIGIGGLFLLGVLLSAGRGWAITGANVVLVQNGQVLVNFTAQTTNGVVFVGSATALNTTAVGATGTVLHGNTAAAPTFSAVSLTADVTGVLPLANGGSNKNITAVAGAVVYSDADSFELSAVGNAGECFKSNGAAAPAFAACGATTPTFPFGSGGMDMTAGSVTHFAGINGAFDQAEGKAQVPVPGMTIANLRCVASATPGGSGITVTARVGTCGTLAPDATLTVTLTTANSVVVDVTGSIVLTANQCLAWAIATVATTTSASVSCIVDRTV